MDEYTDIRQLGAAIKASDALAKADAQDAENLASILDSAGVPEVAVINGTANALTQTGRVLMLVNQRDAAAKKVNEAVNPNAAIELQLIAARGLLGESFVWLTGFEATADLRQRIITFMDQK